MQEKTSQTQLNQKETLARAAERLSAHGRSKRLLVEPGVTAARTNKFTGRIHWKLLDAHSPAHNRAHSRAPSNAHGPAHSQEWDQESQSS